MSRFTKNKITTAISTVLLLSSSYVFAADNLIQQGDFEDGNVDLWLGAGGESAIINDAILNSNVLEVSGRTKDFHAAKQTLVGLIAGHTYSFTGKLRTEATGANVGIGMSYRADLTNDNGSPKDTFVTVGTLISSAGQWLDYSAEFTLPDTFDDSMPAKIWIKSGGGTVTNVYGDDLLLVDNDAVEVVAPSSLSNTASWSNDELNDYWTVNSLEGKALNIMRLTISDNLVNPVDGKTSYADINIWLTTNTEWRWGTYEELVTIGNFFDSADTQVNIEQFLLLMGGQWGPKDGNEEWTALTPTTAQNDGDANPGWGLRVSSTSFSTVGYKANFNPNGLVAAGFLVRETVIEVEDGGSDSDGDGFDDSEDVFPNDANEWLDTDGDGTGDNADNDDDNDGVIDSEDDLPLDDTETIDTDSDGTGNIADTDDDNDGVLDIDDVFPLEASEWLDTDLDGTGNNADTDDDGDTVLDANDAFPLDVEQSINIIVVAPASSDEGTMVTIDASASALGDITYAYSWSQISGRDISLPDDVPSFMFEVPQVTEDEAIVLQIKIDNGIHESIEQINFTILQTTPIVTANVKVEGASSNGKLPNGSSISLDASASFDSDNNALNYLWVQTSGPIVDLQDALSAVTTFTVPNLGSDATISFEVTVTNGAQSATNAVESVIEGNYQEKSAGSFGLLGFLLAAVSVISRRRR